MRQPALSEALAELGLAEDDVERIAKVVAAGNDDGLRCSERRRAEAQIAHQRARLRALSHRLVEVQEAERRHLARELHDEIGQQLTAVKLQLESLQQAAAVPVASGLATVLEAVADLMTRVRQLSLDLRPAMLDDLGLVPALVWLVSRFNADTGIRVELVHEGMDQRPEPQIETAIYRIVQEALTNVARHARTDRASVALRWGAEGLRVEIRDDGVGFDPLDVAAGTGQAGLDGMRERAVLLGGELRVGSRPERGTTVVLELAELPNRARASATRPTRSHGGRR